MFRHLNLAPEDTTGLIWHGFPFKTFTFEVIIPNEYIDPLVAIRNLFAGKIA